MKAISIRIFLVLFLLIPINTHSLQAAAEQRIALVIGNGAYISSPLKNPVNDATDIAATLQKLGFVVTLKKNVNLRAMEESLAEFGERLKKGGTGLFFYAGHGLQVNGINYFVPIGATINRESDIKYETLDAGKVLDEMANAGNGMNIVILDACRDNPFSRSFRNASRGLAIVSNAPTGTFISYSTGPGNVARDGDGRNSPYTDALVKSLKEPGLTIEQIFKKVRAKLDKETGGKQIPWEVSSLKGEFYFITGAPSGKTPVVNDELDDENRKLEAEQQSLDEERASFAKKKVLEEKRQKIADEKEQLAAERDALEQKKLQKNKTLTLIGTTSKEQAKKQDIEIMYAAGHQAFKDGNYDKSRTEFKNFLAAYPNTEYAGSVQYLIGEGYYFEKKYEKAILEFEEVIKNYPKGNKVSSALLYQGLSFLNLNDKTSAKLILQQVIKNFPNTNQSRIALSKLREIGY